MGVVNAAGHLDRLGQALARVGWACTPRYEEKPVRLRVFDPATPRFGDHITVQAGPTAEPWFFSSTGAPVAPVHDLQKAVERIGALIEAFRPTAEQFGLTEPLAPRRERRRPLRRRAR